MLLIETRSHGYYITIFRSPPLSMSPPRRFGIPVHVEHVDHEYPGLNPGEAYIRHRTYVWVDVGRPELERHDYLAWSHRIGLENSGPIRGFEGLRHANEDAVNWEPWDGFAPDGEVSDPISPPAASSPVPTPVPESEPEVESMEVEQGEEENEPMEVERGDEEDEPMEEPAVTESEPDSTDSEEEPYDSSSESSGSDPDWVP